ncbi:UBP1-associated protein 2A-like [Zingiber officinale]|uniref:RRM domain-containing protein n=1 Tax=Zingiber officinale TaxID=94328 RepID=A0A8J5HB30_ZINOF|nr:UBP1-associated protein 2A-like [Zingiber officinale]KAG6519970.1 hypothetical protein ZIOFF_016999 [Zingiber officinale]
MANTGALNRRKRKRIRKSSRKRWQKKNPEEEDPILFGGAIDGEENRPSSSSSHHSDEIRDVLETRTKDELIEILLDAVASDVDLLARVRAAADSDVARRKVFVHGLGRDATREALLEAFRLYGSVEECNLVIDKATGHAKGYGFVLFRTCAGAIKALKQPQKMVDRRLVSCQLTAARADSAGDFNERKMHASNVPADASSENLRSFFSQFGEVERGPLGFDSRTGRSRGYAIFSYKTVEGARKALEEPFKMFEGHRLYCAKAVAPSQKKKAPAAAITTSPAALLGPAPQPVLAAVAAAQNLMIHRQNPAHAPLLAHHPAAIRNTISGGTGLLSLPGQGLGLGSASEPPSILGPYGSQRASGLLE